jgi:hypothetical protein
LSDSSWSRSGRYPDRRQLAALTLLFAGACASGCDDGVISGGVRAAAAAPGGESVPSGEAASVPTSNLPLDGSPIFSQFIRLTHQQWEQSVRDLLRLDAVPRLSDSFTGDPPEGIFSNDERALLVTPNLSLDYQRAAEQLAERVAHDAQALGRLDGVGDSAAFIRALGRRTYRRPMAADELQRYQALFALGPTALGSGDDFADGAQLVIEAMLQSPHFVYRTELEDDGQALNGYEIASKLSFLLRNTTPDDALLDAAESGQFDTNAGIVARARQMLDQPDAAAVAARFHSELFGLDRYSGSLNRSTIASRASRRARSSRATISRPRRAARSPSRRAPMAISGSPKPPRPRTRSGASRPAGKSASMRSRRPRAIPRASRKDPVRSSGSRCTTWPRSARSRAPERSPSTPFHPAIDRTG